MKIIVLDDWSNAFRQMACFKRLHEHEVIVYHDTITDTDELARRLHGAQAVVLTQERTRFDRPLIEKLDTIRFAAQTGSHRHHIDLVACNEKKIAVSAPLKTGTGISTAELTWALILASLRNLPHEVEQLKKGLWQTSFGVGLRGLTLGVYGMGGIGTLVAQVGKAFGMRVIGWGRESSRKKIMDAGYEMPQTREELFSECDVLSLHIFANDQTRGIIGEEDLALMKPSALLVNTSRARLIKEGALVKALKAGRPGRAAVDVYEHEPVFNANHPLLHLPNVICTPHLGYAVEQTFEMLFETAVEHLLAFSEAQPINLLNPEALQ